MLGVSAKTLRWVVQRKGAPSTEPATKTATPVASSASAPARAPGPSAAESTGPGEEEPDAAGAAALSSDGRVRVHFERDAIDASFQDLWIERGDAAPAILVRGRVTGAVYPMAGSAFERLSFTPDSRTLVFQTPAYGASPGVWAFDVPTGQELWRAALFFGGMILDGPYKDFILAGSNHSDGKGIQPIVERA